jgi:hypothetical protein
LADDVGAITRAIRARQAQHRFHYGVGPVKPPFDCAVGEIGTTLSRNVRIRTRPDAPRMTVVVSIGWPRRSAARRRDGAAISADPDQSGQR